MFYSKEVDVDAPSDVKDARNDQSVFIEFQKLIELKEKDVLTEKEFTEEKKKLFAA